MSDVSDQRERTPEEIRRDVRQTRSDMDETLEAIEDRVSPTRIRERQQQRWSHRLHSVRDRVMGTPGAGSRGGGRVEAAADMARHAPDEALERTRGNPLAAGVIAFGTGALLGSLLPTTEPEQEAAQKLRDQYEEDVRREARRVAEEAKEDLGDSAKQASEEVKRTARDAADTTKRKAQGSAEELRQEGDRAKERVRES